MNVLKILLEHIAQTECKEILYIFRVSFRKLSKEERGEGNWGYLDFNVGHDS